MQQLVIIGEIGVVVRCFPCAATGAPRAGMNRLGFEQALSLDGPVCITASEVISVYLLPSVVAAIRAAHPGFTVELVATSAVSDLRRREAGIAIRNFRPEDPELVARKLPDSEAHLYATPEYLRSLGDPDTRTRSRAGTSSASTTPKRTCRA